MYVLFHNDGGGCLLYVIHKQKYDKQNLTYTFSV